MEVSDQFHAPAALPQGKSPWYPLDRGLGGPQSRSGRGEEKNSHPPQGIQPVAKRYTDLAITALLERLLVSEINLESDQAREPNL
jgi:hypothetical protein